MNKDLAYLLEHQNNIIKFSMNRLLNILNCKWVIKTNWLQYYLIHAFQKQSKNGKHVYNVQNLNIKITLDCMAFTTLLSISSSFFTTSINFSKQSYDRKRKTYD